MEGVTLGRAAALSRTRLLLSCTLQGSRQRLLLLLLLREARDERVVAIILFAAAGERPTSRRVGEERDRQKDRKTAASAQGEQK
jgi:hypothetical protein